MAGLPSYHEAISRPQWISVVAPYVSPADYARLCLVDKRFNAEFGPRIWKDPLQTIRRLGRDPVDGWCPPLCLTPSTCHQPCTNTQSDTNRLRYLLTQHVEKMRLATRSLVLSLDFGAMDLTSYHFFDNQLWNGPKAKEDSSRLASAFPRLRCILLDGAADWLVDSVVADLEKDPGSSASLPCLMLTCPKAATISRPAFFLSPHVRSLVYLDLSYAPGAPNAALAAGSLTSLRILKIQGREMDDATALGLLAAFKRQLWSLDVSCNKLTDAILDPMVSISFPAASLRTAAHYDVEGRLNWEASAGHPWYGRFGFIEESEHSSGFKHPARHLADPPLYTRDGEVAPGEHGNSRHDGRRPLRQDSPDGVKEILLGKPNQLPETLEDIARHDICASHGGITHLRLNGNGFDLHGVERMIRESPGQLEHLECDSTLLEVPRWAFRDSLPRWLAAARLTGFVGAAHLLRPVFCPQLQVLRVHHSLITRIPGIKEEHVPPAERLWVAETFFEPRTRMAFPQVFVPDMNPRLYSLTLTDVPRYSSGPLIEKILRFLRQASAQERAIQDTNAAHPHRVSATLRGLRHLHLEFGEDPREAGPDALDLEGLDATKMLGLEDDAFSFFGQSGWASSSSPTRDTQVQAGGPRRKDDDNPSQGETPLFAPENPPPYRSGDAETPDEYLQWSPPPRDWNGRPFTVPVWVSSGVPGPHQAVNEYARLLKNADSHRRVGPASPSHVLAGVPAGSYIYHAAWDAIMAPPTVRKPTAAELSGMRDVVAAIKEYRGKTKAALSAARREAGATDVPLGGPHYHWSGKLEISFPSISHDSGMWR